MTNAVLKAAHRGAQIALHYDLPGTAKLLINGIIRDQSSGQADLHLESVVQTDYEWHESVEGQCLMTDHGVTLAIYMSKVLVISQDFALAEPS